MRRIMPLTICSGPAVSMLTSSTERPRARQQPGELAGGWPYSIGSGIDPAAGGRCESKFGGISNHVAGGLIGNDDERIRHRVAGLSFDEQSGCRFVALGHAGEQLLRG